MTDTEKRRAAKAFAEYWKDRGDEKSDSQSFWLSLARDVLGVAEPEKFILFEERVKLDHTSFIDAHIPSTHVLIEQKKKRPQPSQPHSPVGRLLAESVSTGTALFGRTPLFPASALDRHLQF